MSNFLSSAYSFCTVIWFLTSLPSDSNGSNKPFLHGQLSFMLFQVMLHPFLKKGWAFKLFGFFFLQNSKWSHAHKCSYSITSYIYLYYKLFFENFVHVSIVLFSLIQLFLDPLLFFQPDCVSSVIFNFIPIQIFMLCGPLWCGIIIRRYVLPEANNCQ